MQRSNFLNDLNTMKDTRLEAECVETEKIRTHYDAKK